MKGVTKIRISALAVFILFIMVIAPNLVSGGAQQYDESDGIPPATDLTITANTSNYYDIDGYVTLNWTGATNASVGIANYTIWISIDKGTIYVMNGSNTSNTGFDFYGATATNYTFKIQSVNSSNGDAVSGQNFTWSNASYWFYIEKAATTDLTITANTSNYYDTDGYITVNFTAPSTIAPINNYTIWTSIDKGTTYSSNVTNSSETGFDFYGATATNYTFRVQWTGGEDGSIFNGINLTWANGSYWFVIDKTNAATALSITANSTSYYDGSYITINWTAATLNAMPLINYTVWKSVDKGTTYTQNGTNTSTTGFDFHLIEANYTFKVQWIGGVDGSIVNGDNLTWANGSYWFQIDKTAPGITFSCNNVVQGQSVSCSCSSSDALSGVASTTPTNPGSSGVGTKTASCTSTDNVGNSGSATTTYNVIGGGSGTTPTPTQPSVSKTWDKIEPGAAVSMSINKEGLDFSQIRIEVVNRANNVQITVTKLAEQPASVTQTLDGRYYQYVEISTTNLAESNLENVTVNFKVNKTWIAQNSIDKSMVSLNRWANGQWNAMTTYMTSENDNFTYYESILPGFSFFIISGAEAGPVVCDNDGECETGETTDNCPSDCPAGITCTAGALQCSGNNVQQCNTDGSAWVMTYTCEHGCSSGQCNEAPAADDYVWIIIIAALVIIVIVGWRYFLHKK